MTQLTHSPAPWYFRNTLLRSARGDILIFEEGTADGRLAQAAPELLAACEAALLKMREFNMLLPDNFLQRAVNKAKGV